MCVLLHAAFDLMVLLLALLVFLLLLGRRLAVVGCSSILFLVSFSASALLLFQVKLSKQIAQGGVAPSLLKS